MVWKRKNCWFWWHHYFRLNIGPIFVVENAERNPSVFAFYGQFQQFFIVKVHFIAYWPFSTIRYFLRADCPFPDPRPDDIDTHTHTHIGHCSSMVRLSLPRVWHIIYRAISIQIVLLYPFGLRLNVRPCAFLLFTFFCVCGNIGNYPSTYRNLTWDGREICKRFTVNSGKTHTPCIIFRK